MPKLKAEITKYLADLLRLSELSPDENMFALGYIDSLAAMQLIAHLEKTYTISFDDDDINYDNFKCINTIVSLLKRKQ